LRTCWRWQQTAWRKRVRLLYEWGGHETPNLEVHDLEGASHQVVVHG
jgi:hypothetical protein